MERVASIETAPSARRAGERRAPESPSPSGFLFMSLPLPVDEEERLAVHLGPRDEGSPLRLVMQITI
jgi:hypothetical protein